MSHTDDDLAALRALLADIRPGAAFQSCRYEDGDPTFHCCDWNEIVKRIDAALASPRTQPEGDNACVPFSP